jgi:glycosyltransferase involved in cell wall biosynthesis
VVLLLGLKLFYYQIRINKLNQSNVLPKVLVVSTNAIDGGASIHIETFVDILRNQVDFILVFGSHGPVLARLERKGFYCVVIPELNNRNYILNDLISIFKLVRLIRVHKPNLLHLHSSKAGLVGRITSLFSNTPTIFTVHGWGWRGMSKIKASVILNIERLLSKIPKTFFIYVSKSVEKEALELVHIKENKGGTIVNGTLDFASGGFDKFKKFTIIMPARVSNAKDHITLVSAFEKFDFESTLILCGHGTDQIEFIREMSKFAPKRCGDIVFMGAVENMKELLNKSHVFALISHFEALPLSIIEAMSASLPVIATDVGGVAELVTDGENGFLIDAGNIDLIVKRFNDLILEENQIKIGIRGRERYLERYSAEFMSNSIYLKYLENLIN